LLFPVGREFELETHRIDNVVATARLAGLRVEYSRPLEIHEEASGHPTAPQAKDTCLILVRQKKKFRLIFEKKGSKSGS
jgi:hypothetical protein